MSGSTDAPVEEFAGFYVREYGRTLAVVYSLTGRWSLAEEVTQDAFMRALARWTSVGVMDRPDAWVRRVACNAATSRVRRRMAEARAFTRIGPPSIEGFDVALSERDEGFWAMVRRLPARQAIAVALHYADDLAVADVAVVMGVAEGTVKAHLHAARATLGQVLRGDEEVHT